ncbi:Bax inhibitor-1/YccA family protein [Corynebacterium mastitidis]
MRSSNPVFSNLTETTERELREGGYQQASAERPMTIDDVVTKTGITLAIIIGLGIVNFVIGMMVNPSLAVLLTGVGAIGGFITVLVSAFSKSFGSAAVTLIYAAFEGLFVGGFSFLFANTGFTEGMTGSGSADMAIIGQAILGTVGVFIGMLVVYRTGAVKVTPKFNRILTGVIVGIAVLALGNLLTALIFDFNPLRDGGPLAIVFSLVCIVLAALSFLQDFDQADRLIRAGAPAKNAWGVALGLAVTLVWLYTEILRLLSYLRND